MLDAGYWNPETRNQYPETRDQYPETRDQRPVSRNIGVLPIAIVFPGFLHKDVAHYSVISFSKESPFFKREIAVSRRFSFVFEDSSWCVAVNELYSSNDMMTTPESFPRLIINVSKFLVTLSR